MNYRELYMLIADETDDFTKSEGVIYVDSKAELENALDILSTTYDIVNRDGLDYRSDDPNGRNYKIEYELPIFEEGYNYMNESLNESRKHIGRYKGLDIFKSDRGELTAEDTYGMYYIVAYDLEDLKDKIDDKLYSWNQKADVIMDEAMIEKHDQLNPKLWGKNNELRPEVKEKLNEIVNKFEDNLKDNEVDLDIEDVCIIGSNASYNYNDTSDIDLHIIADTSIYSDEDLALKTYLAYKSLFNDKYDPTVRGIDVEVYVEPHEVHANSKGIYSLNNGWLKEPEAMDIPEVDEAEIDKLSEPYKERAEEVETIEDVDKLIDDIYLQRQQSIQKDGEFGKGNLIFKLLRSLGILQDLKDKKVELENKEMSIEESNMEDRFDENLEKLFIEEDFEEVDNEYFDIQPGAVYSLGPDHKVIINAINDNIVSCTEREGDEEYDYEEDYNILQSMLFEYDAELETPVKPVEEACGEQITEEAEEVQNGFIFKFPDVRDTLQVYLDWEGIYGYTDDIIEFGMEPESSALEDYLAEEGIYGYTYAINNILDGESAFCKDMTREDFEYICRSEYIDPSEATKDMYPSLTEGDFEEAYSVKKKNIENGEDKVIEIDRVDNGDLAQTIADENDGWVEKVDESVDYVFNPEAWNKEKKRFPAYVVEYISGYAGNGVNRIEHEYFRTKEEQEEFVKKLEAQNATGIKTYTWDNCYRAAADESLTEAVDNKVYLLTVGYGDDEWDLGEEEFSSKSLDTIIDFLLNNEEGYYVPDKDKLVSALVNIGDEYFDDADGMYKIKVVDNYQGTNLDEQLDEDIDQQTKNLASKAHSGYELMELIGTRDDIAYNLHKEGVISDDVYSDFCSVIGGMTDDEYEMGYYESLVEKIVKKDGKYQVQSEKGRNLGTYDTKEEAEDRLKEVEMFKHMNESVDEGYNRLKRTFDSFEEAKKFAGFLDKDLEPMIDQFDHENDDGSVSNWYEVYYWDPESFHEDELDEAYKGKDLIFDRHTGSREVDYGINKIRFVTDNYEDAVRWNRQLNATIARDFDNLGDPSEDEKYFDPENYPSSIQQTGDNEYSFWRDRTIVDSLPDSEFVSLDDPIEDHYYDDDELFESADSSRIINIKYLSDNGVSAKEIQKEFPELKFNFKGQTFEVEGNKEDINKLRQRLKVKSLDEAKYLGSCDDDKQKKKEIKDKVIKDKPKNKYDIKADESVFDQDRITAVFDRYDLASDFYNSLDKSLNPKIKRHLDEYNDVVTYKVSYDNDKKKKNEATSVRQSYALNADSPSEAEAIVKDLEDKGYYADQIQGSSIFKIIGSGKAGNEVDRAVKKELGLKEEVLTEGKKEFKDNWTYENPDWRAIWDKAVETCHSNGKGPKPHDIFQEESVKEWTKVLFKYLDDHNIGFEIAYDEYVPKSGIYQIKLNLDNGKQLDVSLQSDLYGEFGNLCKAAWSYDRDHIISMSSHDINDLFKYLDRNFQRDTEINPELYKQGGHDSYDSGYINDEGPELDEGLSQDAKDALDHEFTKIALDKEDYDNLDDEDIEIYVDSACNFNGHAAEDNILSNYESAKRYIRKLAKETSELFDESLNEAVNENDPKAQALALYLDITTDGIDSNYDDGVYDVGNEEYFVGTEDESYERAKDEVKMSFDDMGLDAFTPDFQLFILDNCIDQDEVDNFVEEEIRYFTEDEPDQNMVEYLEGLVDRVQYIRDTLGDDTFKEWAKDKVDLDKLADEAIDRDGKEHFIAYYDGNEIDLGNGLFAYRLN